MSEKTCETCRFWEPRKTIWQWLKQSSEKPATMGTCPKFGGVITRRKLTCTTHQPKDKADE